MTKLFQIYEEDLQKLEHLLPRIAEQIGEAMNQVALQVAFQELKEIAGNVRWNYGPHSEIKRIGTSGNEEGSRG